MQVFFTEAWTRLKLFLVAILIQILHVPVALLLAWYVLVGSPRARKMALAYDQLGNATIGGSDQETISSRAYRGMREGKRGWCLLCRLLDYLQKDHCKLSNGH